METHATADEVDEAGVPKGSMRGRGKIRGLMGGVVGREWSKFQSSSQMMPWLERLCQRPWVACLWVMRYGITHWKQTSMSMALRVVSRASRTPGGGGSGSGGSSCAVHLLLGLRSRPEEDRRCSGGASGRRGWNTFLWSGGLG